MNTAILISVFSLFSAAAMAAPTGTIEKPLLALTSDQDNRIYDLGITLNGQGQLTGLFNKDVSSGGTDSSEADEVAFPLSSIESSHGVVLVKHENYNALLLSGSFDGAKGSGRFTVHYLQNGLTSTYLACDFVLTKSNGNWAVQNAYNRLVVKAIRILTSMFGIANIEGICPVN